MSLPLMVALWLSFGRCGGTATGWLSPWPGCDNGKLLLDRDLPHPLELTCPVSSWPESIQSLPSIDTVYDPQPASQVCMGTPITYNHTIPNSGAYRPLRAEDGEYLYCPPQRWLNNLHHGATVFLYHPCAPLHERVRLSILARSCLSHYVVTPHPDLDKHRPLAVVSWGRTLELSSVATSDVCDWLETTMTGSGLGDVGQTRKYNLLLTWPAEQRQPAERAHRHTNQEEHSHMSVRRCCERTLSSLLDGGTEGEIDRRRRRRSVNEVKGKSSRRQRRAAIRGTVEKGGEEREGGNRTADDVTSLLTNLTARTILSSTEPGEVQRHDNISEPESDSGARSSPEPVLRSDLPGPRRTGPPAPGSELGNQNLNTQRPVPNALEPTPRAEPTSVATVASKPKASPEPQKQELTGRPEPPQPEHMNPKHSNPTPRTDTLVNGVSRKRNLTPRPGTPELEQVTQALSKEENTKEERKEGENQREKDSDKHGEKDSDEQNKTEDKTADGGKQRERDSGKQQDTAGETVRDYALVDVKEREVESKHAHSNAHAHSRSKKVGSWSGSVSQHQPESHAHLQPHHKQPQPVTQLSEKPDCGACNPDGHCECTESSGPQGGATVLRKGVPRTPRTDEAVWAAVALGFLLVLLALSVLHTRLYRHWRTMPSLYWRDPQQDYDSVADVIRRRLRISERRRKRRTSLSRRQECALLPDSTSDEED